jgi:hypothetical protein
MIQVNSWHALKVVEMDARQGVKQLRGNQD